MTITEILRPQCVRVPLSATDKFEAITELVDLLNEFGHLESRDLVLKAIVEREQAHTTGIGLGLAVPHGKSEGVSKLTVAFGKPAAPLDFASVDGAPCDLIVLLASPIDQTGPHIQALSGVSRLWQQEGFRQAVRDAATAESLYAAVEQHQA